MKKEYIIISSILLFKTVLCCNIFRNFTINGPLNLKMFPFFNDFSAHSMTHTQVDNIIDGRQSCSQNQVPEIAKSHMKWVGSCYEKTWSKELVEVLVQAAINKTDFSPADYPYCVLDYYSALNKYTVEGKRVLVAGSISPWNEAIFIAAGARQVLTSEYSELVSLDDRIKVLHASKLIHFEKFDAISSFSSIEHDGLGRYGDPINPSGDFNAISEFHYLLHPGGILYLGIPVSGKQGFIEGNLHRLYSFDRIYAMIKDKFEIVDIIEDHYKYYEVNRVDWQHQPLIVLKKA